MCLTSPPYWGLRDYGVPGQLGLEPDFHDYINKLVTVFDEVKRVLKKTGSCWVVIGDTYHYTNQKQTPIRYFSSTSSTRDRSKDYCKARQLKTRPRAHGIPSKSLAMIPSRFAIAMIDDGWILRNVIVWDKPNPMPSSAKDRFTVSHEYIFFFTKSQKYYFETQYEPMLAPITGVKFGGNKAKGYGNPVYSGNEWIPSEFGRIKRSVWKIATHPYKEAHFATFPEKLCETPIQACCPHFICVKCGKARQIIYNEKRINTRPGIDTGNGKSGKRGEDPNATLHNSELSKFRQEIIRVRKTLSDCGCNTGFQRGVVLDPFFGAGTVGLVALRQDKAFIGIELNKQYCKLAEKRLEPLLAQKRMLDY